MDQQTDVSKTHVAIFDVFFACFKASNVFTVFHNPINVPVFSKNQLKVLQGVSNHKDISKTQV